MEELIELLNEYDKINENNNKWFRNEYGYLDREYGWATVSSSCWKVISKDYGFIKWLVENDKINFSRYGDLSIELVNLFGRRLDNAEGVIALLSIKDNPIEFLISILK